MAPAKRRANTAADAASIATTKRQKKVVEPTASSSRPSRNTLALATAPRSTRSSISEKSMPAGPAKKTTKISVNGTATKSAPKTATKVKATDGGKRGRPAKKKTNEEETAKSEEPSTLFVDVPLREKPAVNAEAEEEAEINSEGPAYWLMKAEPESRIEKGQDVKFSIDDLKAANHPEGWDGVRNPVARNNMRLMIKGDMAFFYHSNCKVPGIVGTMEIVQEHSVDETAFDPEHPYFDEKSDREKPKWCLVHVKFVQKFPEMIRLKALQKYAKDGGVLENMQVLKQSRLSVSKVTKKEWDFIMNLNDVEDVAAMSAAHQPKMVS
ncbi:MAG: hypothetical protein ALECFALPRED_002668 [Alectoria fallacina]|uniref:Thymocyte nuclear protein 1 n=1 Tax=Alectoria fallacina TaxID=1903189 RepID=A0A8H3EMM1_9LECA|nr:MAG: hypothetical protein ALECFALPRED_002668 [Alectoria fallacina]